MLVFEAEAAEWLTDEIREEHGIETQCMLLSGFIEIDSVPRRRSGIPTKAPLKCAVLKDGNER